MFVCQIPSRDAHQSKMPSQQPDSNVFERRLDSPRNYRVCDWPFEVGDSVEASLLGADIWSKEEDNDSIGGAITQ